MTDRSRTTLTRYAPLMRDPQPEEARRLAKETYNNTQGEVVLINRSWLTSWADRKQLELLASKALGVKGLGS